MKVRNERAHEISGELGENIQTFSMSISRRITRFISLKNPTFVRIDTQHISIDKYLELFQELDRYFSKYKIIIISPNKYSGVNILDDFSRNVQFIYMDSHSTDWKMPQVNWRDIFYKTEGLE